MNNFFDLTIQELEEKLASLDGKPFRSGQILKWVYTRGASDFMAMSDMPLLLRRTLAERFDLNPLREVQRRQTSDGTVKFLYGLPDEQRIETVLIPEEGHHTLCLSTQSGCSMACAFCETGRSQGGRDLTRGEILAQIVYAIRHTGERLAVRNLVFMGMGEPLQNLDALLPALEIILSPRALDFSPRRVTISTCGWVPGVRRLAAEGLDVNLAVSLNAADDETRTRIMPVNRKYPIPVLLDALRDYPLRTRKRITFEYVLIKGLNDSVHDARRLGGLLKGLSAKVNLIPCNENRSGYVAPEQQKARAFQETLLALGVLATLRKSRGSEIGAACGQLKAASSGGEYG